MLRLRRSKKNEKSGPSRAEVLRSRPIRNPAVTWGEDAQGDTVIHVPLVKKAWMSRFGRFLPAPDTRHILLDDIGADVWKLCDGETSIEEIRRRITEKYQLNHKEAEASLLEHLKQLARRKLIVAVAGKADEAAAEEEASPPEKRNVQLPGRRKKRK